MKHSIIGTAGHVDHGKSTLIAALTGIDPDRLKEEKKRGITIELGFAFLDLPDGSKAGVVDVPGHERFVRNMLAGAGGVDLALLIVAADEGVMPQTREHLEILKLLEIRHGLIVMTKADLVDEEWLELAQEDIREEVRGSFLENAPIFPVSSVSGKGIPELRQAIFKMIEILPEKNIQAPYRQPIDRVFSLEGHGTIVTGTLIEGRVALGNMVTIYPEGIDARVRSIQVHGQDVSEAFAGQRVAVNLAQLSKDKILRGDVLAAKGSMDNSEILDVEVCILDNCPYVIKNSSRLHFHYGSSSSVARIRLLGKSELRAGERAPARLILEDSLAVKYGDHFVLRFFSPLDTVGGGRILDPSPRTLRIREEEWGTRLEQLAQAGPEERLIAAVDSASPVFSDLASALRRSGVSELPEEDRREILAKAEKSGKIFPLSQNIWLSRVFTDNMGRHARQILCAYHEEHQLKAGLKREELRTRLLPEIKIEWTDKLLDILLEHGDIVEKSGLLADPNFKIKITAEQKNMRAEMEKIYEEAGFAPPDTPELLSRYPAKQKPEAVFSDLIDSGILRRLDAGIAMHSRYVEEARDFVIEHIREHGELKLADFRDHIGSSRKFAVAILDSFDRERLTRLIGDSRILL